MTRMNNMILAERDDYVHSFVCRECGVAFPGETDSGEASVLSGGNLALIVGIAAAAIFGLLGFAIGRKRIK